MRKPNNADLFMERVPFIATESDKDLMVSFAIEGDQKSLAKLPYFLS